MQKTSKRILAVGLPLSAVAVTGVGLAYFSGSGSGTTTAATSTGVTTLVASANAISGLAPGVAAKTISGTVANSSGESAYVAHVVASIAGVTKAATAPAGTCDATDYALSGATMPVAADVASGSTASFSGATIAFVNKATNQDACKGATVTLAFVVS